MYITPAVEIAETVASQMMALSLQDVAADDSAILVEEENDWNVWDEE